MTINQFSWETLLNPEVEVTAEFVDGLMRYWRDESPENLREALNGIRSRYTRRVQHADSLQTIARKSEHTVATLSTQLRHANSDLGNMITRYAEDTTPVEMDSDLARRWLGYVVEFAIRIGHAHEAHRLCVELSQQHPQASDVWDTVSQRLRQEDGRYPDPVHWAIAHADARANNQAHVHPANPVLSEFWKTVWIVAKTDADFCNVWDDHAENLGIPRPELPTRRGTVDVQATVYLSIEVEGVEFGESGWSVIDSENVEEALRRGEGELADYEVTDEYLDVEE